MSFTLIQAGTALQSINTDGTLSSALALPSSILLTADRTPRFARFKRYVIVVNTPTRPLSVSDSGVVRPLTLIKPADAVVLSAGAAGTLTGTYRTLQTYIITDTDGNIISESDFSAASNQQAITSQNLHAAFDLSTETVSATRLYRTATLGSTYFHWVDVAGNATALYEGGEADSALAVVAAPNLGSAPDLTLVCEWGGRLWGVDRTDVDDLRFTESGTMYAWYALNTIPITPVGTDSAGITALVPRRNSLGVGRKNSFSVINGTGLSNFTQTQHGREIGVESQESVVIYKDTAFFLWRDGVYTWDNNGFKCISDGKVRSWFTTDTYFNRSMFWRAFAHLDPATLSYRLFLPSVGSTSFDRWIEYDLTTGAWFGPHKTAAFTPTSALIVYGANQQPYDMIGSSAGFISQDQETRTDWSATAIDMVAETKKHVAGDADSEKFWGELSVNGKVQSAGTVTVTTTVGEVEATADATTMSYDMTQGRQRLGRIGTGKAMSLQLENNVAAQDVMIYGLEVNPVNPIGRR